MSTSDKAGTLNVKTASLVRASTRTEHSQIRIKQTGRD